MIVEPDDAPMHIESDESVASVHAATWGYTVSWDKQGEYLVGGKWQLISWAWPPRGRMQPWQIGFTDVTPVTVVVTR